MKQIIKTSIFVFLCTLTCQQLLAQNKTETELLGTWVMDYNNTLNDIHDQGGKTYETMNSVIRDRIISNYKGRELTFFENGTFGLKLTDDRKANGTWSISGNKLMMVSSTGTDFDYMIHKLEDNMLVLKTKEYGNTKPIFKNLHFTKN